MVGSLGIGEPVQWYLSLIVRREKDGWLPGNRGTSPLVFIPDSKEGRMVGFLEIKDPVQWILLTGKEVRWLAVWE